MARNQCILIIVRSPLGHGADFNLGAEEVSATGGVEQAYGGGTPESSTMVNPTEEAVGAYINSVDVGGAIAEGLGGQNAFVASRYPGSASTQPPVSYGAEAATMAVKGNAYATQAGSITMNLGPMCDLEHPLRQIFTSAMSCLRR